MAELMWLNYLPQPATVGGRGCVPHQRRQDLAPSSPLGAGSAFGVIPGSFLSMDGLPETSRGPVRSGLLLAQPLPGPLCSARSWHHVLGPSAGQGCGFRLIFTTSHMWSGCWESAKLVPEQGQLIPGREPCWRQGGLRHRPSLQGPGYGWPEAGWASHRQIRTHMSFSSYADQSVHGHSAHFSRVSGAGVPASALRSPHDRGGGPSPGPCQSKPGGKSQPQMLFSTPMYPLHNTQGSF